MVLTGHEDKITLLKEYKWWKEDILMPEYSLGKEKPIKSTTLGSQRWVWYIAPVVKTCYLFTPYFDKCILLSD